MINLHNVDCLEFMRALPDNHFDLCFTDPPYGIGADKGTSGFGIRKVSLYESSWDNKTPNADVFTEILRVSKTAIIFGGNYFTDKLPVSSHWLVWDKKGSIEFKNPFSDCELIWTNVKKKTVKKYTVIQQGFISEEKERFHPTQKPVKLISQILDNYSKDDFSIFDPFMGSGTVGISSKKKGLSFTGCEIDPNYFKIAEKRINDSLLP